jgi:hypothetical protein
MLAVSAAPLKKSRKIRGLCVKIPHSFFKEVTMARSRQKRKTVNKKK